MIIVLLALIVGLAYFSAMQWVKYHDLWQRCDDELSLLRIRFNLYQKVTEPLIKSTKKLKRSEVEK